MTEELQQQPSPTFSIVLPQRARWIVAGAFLLGLLLFLIGWLSGRDKTFFQAEGQPAPAQDIALAPLPAPLAAGGASQMPAPAASTPQERPHLVEEPVAAEPAAVAEPAIAAATAVPPAAASTAEPGSDSPPLRIAEQSPPPAYPASALRKGERGVVLLKVMVDAQGRPERVRVIQRSGSRALDRAAVEAVQQWRFQPAVSAGQPVAGEVEIPIEFSP